MIIIIMQDHDVGCMCNEPEQYVGYFNKQFCTEIEAAIKAATTEF